MRSGKQYAVYIMSNAHRTVFYIGVTRNLAKRVLQHKQGTGCQFTLKYNCYDLLYFETYEQPRTAIAREKNLKNWHRAWKINLIRQLNPELKDLAAGW
jgi:putative endonuclease